jgi:hypothetical protein
LGEYQVPYLGEPAAVTIGPTLSFTTAKLFTEVIMNFAARSAGARIANRPPEVTLFSESQYPPGGNANLTPISESFVIVKVNGYPQPFDRQLQIPGDKFPSPRNSFLLKIIADAEIAQHLEEGKMFTITHQVYISGTKTLLARS